jgi:hypothetical protein
LQLWPCLCVGKDLSKFSGKGDMPQMADDAMSGNIDFMRVDLAASTQVLVPILFGGMMEAEASTLRWRNCSHDRSDAGQTRADHGRRQ